MSLEDLVKFLHKYGKNRFRNPQKVADKLKQVGRRVLSDKTFFGFLCPPYPNHDPPEYQGIGEVSQKGG